jgi:hypothetical protein
LGEFDLFVFFRFLLATLVCVYGTIRLVVFVWHWQGLGQGGLVGSPLLWRYLTALVLRARLRSFVYELTVIGGLVAVLILLLRLH